MLQLDTRTGQEELEQLIKKRGIKVEVTKLEFGDAAFLGHGPQDEPVCVGIEIKKVADVLKCITDGRFAGHQLPGLVASYEFAWLLVEGQFRADMHTGVLQITGHKGYFHDAHIGARQFMYRDLDHWLLTMSIKTGIKVIRAFNRYETAQILADIYTWFTDKGYDGHKSHLAMDTSRDPDRSLLVKPSLVRRVASQLPGIGLEKSAAVSKVFPSIESMIAAPEELWRNIPGIGVKIAANVVRAIKGETVAVPSAQAE